tara:strand:+ start:3013 stop:3960 length:948 start_codon:yes stop_codon:yes gene_type:complete
MPGTIRIGNEGLRTNIETDSDGNLYLSTPSNDTSINFISGSIADASSSANRIRFIQDSGSGVGGHRAFIHISGSSTHECGYNIDTEAYDRLIRANRDMMVSNTATVFNVGLVTGSQARTGYVIANSIALDAFERFFIQDRQYGDTIEMTGSVKVSGSFLLNGSAVGGTPGGSDTHIQFNDGGSLGGDSDFVWNKTTNALTINGTLNATRKSFVVNHQKIDNHNLVHGSLEGPEFGVYIRGKIDNDNKIALPDYWEWLVDEDSISVHITPIGYHILPLYFKEIKDNYVYVNKKTNFYYYICAERKDIEKLKIIEKK